MKTQKEIIRRVSEKHPLRFWTQVVPADKKGREYQAPGTNARVPKSNVIERDGLVYGAFKSPVGDVKFVAFGDLTAPTLDELVVQSDELARLLDEAVAAQRRKVELQAQPSAAQPSDEPQSSDEPTGLPAEIVERIEKKEAEIWRKYDEAVAKILAGEFETKIFAGAPDSFLRKTARGYHFGAWVSNNAVSAREAGLETATTIAKKFKVTSDYIHFRFDSDEKHHTSLYANQTPFYWVKLVGRWIESPEGKADFRAYKRAKSAVERRTK
ncbi:MAG: hypothetical protein RMM53_12915 [Bacteroidia bacterium]|nr:hypothetical protein [Bacteroidia bacterium]